MDEKRLQEIEESLTNTDRDAWELIAEVRRLRASTPVFVDGNGNEFPNIEPGEIVYMKPPEPADAAALRAEVRRLRGLIKEVERDVEGECPFCGVDRSRATGVPHQDGCAGFLPDGTVR